MNLNHTPAQQKGQSNSAPVIINPIALSPSGGETPRHVIINWIKENCSGKEKAKTTYDICQHFEIPTRQLRNICNIARKNKILIIFDTDVGIYFVIRESERQEFVGKLKGLLLDYAEQIKCAESVVIVEQKTEPKDYQQVKFGFANKVKF